VPASTAPTPKSSRSSSRWISSNPSSRSRSTLSSGSVAREASVHGTELDETHFHEVGADDAIADVVGAALLLDDLDPERVVTTPVATGGGEVEMSHGVYPVPAPATTEVAAGADFS